MGQKTKQRCCGTWRRSYDYAAAAMLILVVSIVYKQHLNLPFTTGGPDVFEWYDEAIERKSLWDVFDYTRPSWRPTFNSYYQPVQLLIWKVMVYFFDKEPTPYYLLGLAVHSINTLLVFYLACEIIRNPLLSFAAAFSYGVYYVSFTVLDSTAAVVTQGFTGLFFFLTLFLYIRYTHTRRRGYYYLSVVSFLTGLLTKETMMTVSPVICAYYLLFDRKPILKLQRGDVYLTPFIVFCLPIVYIDAVRLENSGLANSWGGTNFGVHMVYRLIDYLSFLVSVVPVSSGLRMVLAYSILLVAPFVAYYSFKDRTLLLLVFWVVCSLSMYLFSNFRDIYTLGRYLYVAAAPWYILVYHVVGKIQDRVLKLFAASAAVSYSILLNIALIFLR